MKNSKNKDYLWALFDKNKKQHKYILSLCIQIGWSTIYKGRVQADLNRLGAFIKSPKCAVNKPLKKMSSNELQLLIYQLEKIQTT